ncbi:hypothetical protein DFP72DRAFT_1061173 [Ephemerocybe angulata]|uniref:Uncharacterized protein n=1 Tax=Ephemerocybe angulata TaxID=980116 RepID=A0A8H6IB48_9AGAR|nr:hypothetical protein DFP72DRAFT_1061173 [Tulosesus angulatus]
MSSEPPPLSSQRTTSTSRHHESPEIDASQSTTPQHYVQRRALSIVPSRPGSSQRRSSSPCHARFPRSLMDEDEVISTQGPTGPSSQSESGGQGLSSVSGAPAPELAASLTREAPSSPPPLEEISSVSPAESISTALSPAPSMLPSMHVMTEDLLLQPVYSHLPLVQGTVLPWSEQPGPSSLWGLDEPPRGHGRSRGSLRRGRSGRRSRNGRMPSS